MKLNKKATKEEIAKGDIRIIIGKYTVDRIQREDFLIFCSSPLLGAHINKNILKNVLPDNENSEDNANEMICACFSISSIMDLIQSFSNSIKAENNIIRKLYDKMEGRKIKKSEKETIYCQIYFATLQAEEYNFYMKYALLALRNRENLIFREISEGENEKNNYHPDLQFSHMNGTWTDSLDM